MGLMCFKGIQKKGATKLPLHHFMLSNQKTTAQEQLDLKNALNHLSQGVFVPVPPQDQLMRFLLKPFHGIKTQQGYLFNSEFKNPKTSRGICKGQ